MFLRIIFLILLLGFAATISLGSIVKVVGDGHTLVLTSDGKVIGWGPCERGELGPISAIPRIRGWATTFVEIKLPRKAIDVAAAGAASLALLDDGTVFAWGFNYNDLLGTEVRSMLPSGASGSEVPIMVPGLSDVTAISAGGQYVTALKRDGTVYVWGVGSKILGGDGKRPTQVPGASGIKQISTSSSHTMALDQNGNVWTWGGSSYGQLGRITDIDKAAKVAGILGVISVASGSGVSTVLKRDGTVWVWGSNWQAQFGNGKRTAQPVYGGLSNDIQTTPVQVPGVSNAVALTSGVSGRHTIVLLKDGTLRGWGSSDWGQLGGGVSGGHQPSVMIPKLTGVKTIFAVNNNTYAIKTDGSVWIWGDASSVGFPLKTQAKVPVRFEGI